MVNGNIPTLDDVIELFISIDTPVVLLPIKEGEKRARKGWPNVDLEQAHTPAYIGRLRSNANTGVLLGEPSCGLCTIDCDTQPLLEAVLAANLQLNGTLLSRGERAGQFWFFALGERPRKVHPLKVQADSPLAVGLKEPKVDKNGLVTIGEWRAEGGQSIIRGIHPCGQPYTWLQAARPITVNFESLQWPAGIVLPWNNTEANATSAAAPDTDTHPEKENDGDLLQRAKAMLSIDRLWEHFGYPQRKTNPVDSPFRTDNTPGHPSFSVYDNGARFKDHNAAYEHHHGDCFDFYQLATGLDAHTAFKGFVELAGLGDELRSTAGTKQKDQTPEDQAQEEAARKLESHAEKIARSLDAYYDIHKEKYILLSTENRWHPAGAGTIRQNLRLRGISSKLLPRRTFSRADIILSYIQHHRDVYFCGSLAGRKIGFYQENGSRLLVTTQAELIAPQPVPWPTLQAILGGLFFDSESEDIGHDQTTTLHAWVRTFYMSLRDDRFAPGQILAICGPINCGKSFLQDIITYLFGGRATKGTLFLQGRTDFNSHLFDGEHVKMEDEGSSTSYSDRRALGEELKKIAVNRTFELHGKGDKALTVEARRRVTITLNDTAERIAILPPIGYDLEDKMIILHASDFEWPMPMDNSENQAACLAQVKSELPGYIHFLLNEFRLPSAMFEPRMGVKAFQHPGILSLMDEISPGTHLLFLIDKAKPWGLQNSQWEGSAAELRDILLHNDSTKRDAENLLKHLNACGTYLGLIAKSHSDRVQPQRTKDQRWWLINAP